MQAAPSETESPKKPSVPWMSWWPFIGLGVITVLWVGGVLYYLFISPEGRITAQPDFAQITPPSARIPLPTSTITYTYTQPFFQIHYSPQVSYGERKDGTTLTTLLFRSNNGGMLVADINPKNFNNIYLPNTRTTSFPVSGQILTKHYLSNTSVITSTLKDKQGNSVFFEYQLPDDPDKSSQDELLFDSIVSSFAFTTN